MVYETSIKLKHYDPQTLSDDLRAVTELLECLNTQRQSTQRPNGESAILAAENILRDGAA